MRNKVEQEKITKDMKKRQEKEFLQHVKELDDLERRRYMNGRKAVNTDFVEGNARIKEEYNQKKEFLKN